MVERIKNKKGFTIIEIMVVIALIGILATVLVPKFVGVKDKAKDMGMLANAKMVEAFVASEIDNWNQSNAIDATTPGTGDFIKAINDHFDTNKLIDPYTGSDSGALVVETTAGTDYKTGGSAGIVYVVIDKSSTRLKVFINGFDADGDEIKATKRTVIQ